MTAPSPALAVDAIKGAVEFLTIQGRCKCCGVEWYDVDGEARHHEGCLAIAAEAQLTALLVAVEQGRKDTERLDWLEDNLAYVMLSSDYKKGRSTIESLNSRGHGWRNGELRYAVDGAIDAALAAVARREEP